MLLMIGGLAAVTVALAMAAPTASACRVASSHGYLLHRDIPKALGQNDVVLEVEVDPGQFVERGPYLLKVKRVVRGDFDKAVVTVVWDQTSCSYIRFAEIDSLVVGQLEQRDGEKVLVARELRLTAAEHSEGRP